MSATAFASPFLGFEGLKEIPFTCRDAPLGLTASRAFGSTLCIGLLGLAYPTQFHPLALDFGFALRLTRGLLSAALAFQFRFTFRFAPCLLFGSTLTRELGLAFSFSTSRFRGLALSFASRSLLSLALALSLPARLLLGLALPLSAGSLFRSTLRFAPRLLFGPPLALELSTAFRLSSRRLLGLPLSFTTSRLFCPALCLSLCLQTRGRSRRIPCVFRRSFWLWL